MSEKLRRVGEVIDSHLQEIEKLFVPGVKLTLLARCPSMPDGEGDVVLTKDDLAKVRDAIDTFMAKEMIAGVHPVAEPAAPPAGEGV